MYKVFKKNKHRIKETESVMMFLLPFLTFLYYIPKSLNHETLPMIVASVVVSFIVMIITVFFHVWMRESVLQKNIFIPWIPFHCIYFVLFSTSIALVNLFYFVIDKSLVLKKYLYLDNSNEKEKIKKTIS